MAIVLKTKEQIGIMRKGGKLLAEILDQVCDLVKPGVSTLELDKKAFDLCKFYNVKPAFLGYEEFPNTLCVGIDDVAVHGIPSEIDVLKSGQIISIDMGIIYNGIYVDHAKTVGVGEVDEQAKRLIETTKLALMASIKAVKIGNRIGDISSAMQTVIEMAGFSPIYQMTGHGVGINLHEEPAIPCLGKKGTGVLLVENMTLAIEAMVNEGEGELFIENDGWTSKTIDGKRSALFENTVLVTKKGAEILTIH